MFVGPQAAATNTSAQSHGSSRPGTAAAANGMQETKEWDTPGGSSKSGEGGDGGLALGKGCGWCWLGKGGAGLGVGKVVAIGVTPQLCRPIGKALCLWAAGGGTTVHPIEWPMGGAGSIKKHNPIPLP
eukprot:CAMPEP_0174310972 /NCGR_PEP_ID=MMETSP0810-20121108/3404_1 /TAXON_ID=73025 ORGANISM="Eutreptiella gymnastica-like, Strain CCMP1594" /NCGR_SAMPLE_ID=MMETSP0810 /ASSEMBLY_ACC=CAM_ASM_000659 /LENGTH=127 /DNA_ID=CAMNT_0015419059 /DNA_START=1696 /DNA_END=2079 /DNA_ORIENTATION=+